LKKTEGRGELWGPLLKILKFGKNAEGSERKSIPDFQRFINIAQGSAAELRTLIYISREVNIFSDLDAKELIQELKSISRMLQSLHSSLKKL
jgi:four helix bundle protein